MVAWKASLTRCVVNGNRNVPNLNDWNSKRNLNLNWFENDWNDNYRFLAVRYCLAFSGNYFSGVLFKVCRRQPPSIRPASSMCSERCVYFLLSIDLVSQASCSMSFNRSTLAMHLSSKTSFSFELLYPARKQYSMALKKISSILEPMVNRLAFGKCVSAFCQRPYVSFNFKTTDVSFRVILLL